MWVVEAIDSMTTIIPALQKCIWLPRISSCNMAACLSCLPSAERCLRTIRFGMESECGCWLEWAAFSPDAEAADEWQVDVALVME